MQPNTKIRHDRSEYRKRDRTRSTAAKQRTRARRAQRSLKARSR